MLFQNRNSVPVNDYKIYCPGVGLVVDDVIELVDYGYVGDDDDD